MKALIYRKQRVIGRLNQKHITPANIRILANNGYLVLLNNYDQRSILK